MPGSKVMRQSGAETLATEEPYELIAHVRDCGGAGWATTGSTRKRDSAKNVASLCSIRHYHSGNKTVMLQPLQHVTFDTYNGNTG
jgi:hypothetical protein